MDKNKTNQASSSRYKGLTIALTTTLLLTILLAYSSHNLVLAENHSKNVNSGIKDLVFGTNTQQERSSRRPKLLHIKKGEYVYNIFTLETDIHKILKEYQIPISGEDRIVISNEHMTDGTLVRVIKTDAVIEDVLIEIPFETKIIKTDQYPMGEEYITQQGVLGVRKQTVLNYYEDGVLIEKKVISDIVTRQPGTQVLEIGTSLYSLNGIDPKGYNCEYWHSVVDTGPYSDEEKRWMKFIMYCESGCNAESNKGSYKGLFQWSPFWWSKQFPENIFDGHAQIKHTISKYRAGESTRLSQWPACHARYVRTYGSN